MVLVHKYVDKGNQTLFTMKSEKGEARTRRAAGAKNIASQYTRTDIRKESFAIRVVETWNRLPDKVKQRYTALIQTISWLPTTFGIRVNNTSTWGPRQSTLHTKYHR
jgi:hypothetical protein